MRDGDSLDPNSNHGGRDEGADSRDGRSGLLSGCGDSGDRGVPDDS